MPEGGLATSRMDVQDSYGSKSPYRVVVHMEDAREATPSATAGEGLS